MTANTRSRRKKRSVIQFYVRFLIGYGALTGFNVGDEKHPHYLRVSKKRTVARIRCSGGGSKASATGVKVAGIGTSNVEAKELDMARPELSRVWSLDRRRVLDRVRLLSVHAWSQHFWQEARHNNAATDPAP
jgi:ribosomal protein S8E